MGYKIIQVSETKYIAKYRVAFLFFKLWRTFGYCSVGRDCPIWIPFYFGSIEEAETAIKRHTPAKFKPVTVKQG